jgi:hypothetical protein
MAHARGTPGAREYSRPLRKSIGALVAGGGPTAPCVADLSEDDPDSDGVRGEAGRPTAGERSASRLRQAPGRGRVAGVRAGGERSREYEQAANARGERPGYVNCGARKELL